MVRMVSMDNGLEYVTCLTEQSVYASIWKNYFGEYTLSINDFRTEPFSQSDVSSDDLPWLVKRMHHVFENLQMES